MSLNNVQWISKKNTAEVLWPQTASKETQVEQWQSSLSAVTDYPRAAQLRKAWELWWHHSIQSEPTLGAALQYREQGMCIPGTQRALSPKPHIHEKYNGRDFFLPWIFNFPDSSLSAYHKVPTNVCDFLCCLSKASRPFPVMPWKLLQCALIPLI